LVYNSGSHFIEKTNGIKYLYASLDNDPYGRAVVVAGYINSDQYSTRYNKEFCVLAEQLVLNKRNEMRDDRRNSAFRYL